jgi:AcrR family transcriptional regulator
MARPRKVSDEQIMMAAIRAMNRLGPGELTLAEIAAEAGVTAGALVQRFGSKRELLLALAAAGAEGVDELILQLAEKHRSPLAALREYAECMAQLAESPAALARNLAYLQIDLTDEDFRVHLLKQARGTRRGIQGLLEKAVRAGELGRTTDVGMLARHIEIVLSGALLTWATYREGTPARWIRNAVDAAIAPHEVRRRKTGRASS